MKHYAINKTNQWSTKATPKSLADLQYQGCVIRSESAHSVRVAAEEAFNELFPGNETAVKVNFLFTEMDAEGTVAVYEAYIDSGSTDYVYIVMPIS